MTTHSSIFPGESHGHRNLAGYSLLGHTELDMTAVTWRSTQSLLSLSLILYFLSFFFFLNSVGQSCLPLWDPIHCSPLGSSLHGISQAKILEWVAIPSSRRPSQPRDQTHLLHWQADSLPLSHQGSTLSGLVWT